MFPMKVVFAWAAGKVIVSKGVMWLLANLHLTFCLAALYIGPQMSVNLEHSKRESSFCSTSVAGLLVRFVVYRGGLQGRMDGDLIQWQFRLDAINGGVSAGPFDLESLRRRWDGAG